ncbi:MAG: hypothetical protein LUD74_07445 [Tannerellaceae bacterium]|nr:hypothetical protein [Tannerellaceae bacterium]
MKEVIQYIIQFLLGDDVPGELVNSIGYTSDPAEYYRYNIVLRPSGFLIITTTVVPHLYLNIRWKR